MFKVVMLGLIYKAVQDFFILVRFYKRYNILEGLETP